MKEKEGKKQSREKAWLYGIRYSIGIPNQTCTEISKLPPFLSTFGRTCKKEAQHYSLAQIYPYIVSLSFKVFILFPRMLVSLAERRAGGVRNEAS